MALVAYDCSSESEGEPDRHEEHKGKTGVIATDLLLKDKPSESKVDASDVQVKTKAQLGSDEVEKEFQMRIPASVKQLKTIDKRNGKVQILAPSLDSVESDSDDEHANERTRRRVAHGSKQPEKRASALLGILPPARNREVLRRDRNEVSDSSSDISFLKAKPTPDAGATPLATESVARKSVAFGFVPAQIKRQSAAAAKAKADADADEDEQCPTKFFTFADDEIPGSVTPLPPPLPVSSAAGPSNSYLRGDQHVVTQQIWDSDDNGETRNDPQQSDDLGLDDTALRRLVGKAQFGRNAATASTTWAAPATHVDANSCLTPVHELARELTHADERRALASRLHVQTTNSTEKRKHQITWLAAQAKERELELLNSWAESKFNRRQTQAKYGF